MADREDFFIDTHRIDQVAASLGNVPRQTLPKVRSAVQYNANLVKQTWRSSLAGNRFAPRVPYSITYDTKELAGGVTAEIGAEKGTGKQGGVALLLEYGAPRQRLGPRGYGMKAMLDNLEDLQDGIRKAIDDGVAAAGL